MSRKLPKISRTAKVAMVAVALAGLAGTGFAASVTTPPSNAGQGVDVTEGFTATSLYYDAAPNANDEWAYINAVHFNLTRDGTAQQFGNVSLETTEVYVQLRDGTVRSDWVKCDVGSGPSAGEVVCDTSGATDTIKAIDIDSLSIVAYDSTDDAP